jgi:PPK2 family polyphosphate:nucleotide phosphotransferase
MIKLSELSTRAPENISKAEAKKRLLELNEEIADKITILHAQKKHSLLIVFQGMDSSGKDGATKKVFRKCSQSHINTYAFKKPSDLEFAHDFLWRVHKEAPAKGEVKIFIRSHYEDILIQRVHNWIDEERVTARINAINAFEKNLQIDNNTTVVKFFLHLSKERQLEKLTERVEVPEKNWKHNDGDWKERKYWDDYMRCYEDALNRSEIPWIVAPVDQRWYRNLFIAQKINEVLDGLDLSLPTLDPKPDITQLLQD